MSKFIPSLTESETYIKGRSGKTVRALLESAGDRGAEIRTTSFGYILPTDLVPAGDFETYTSGDRPAVPTEPGTSTNVDEVNNVGQASTAVAEAKTAEVEAAAEDSDPAAGEEAADEEPNAELFDPSKATIAEIEDYFDGADAAEQERVLAAEAAGKNRKGVLELAEPSEGAK